MPATACPHCAAELDLGSADVGQVGECPACGREFTADPPWRSAAGPPPRRGAYADHRRGRFDDSTDRTRRERDWPYRDHGESPQALVRDAQARCTAAGVGLMVVGVITTVLGLTCTVGSLYLQFFEGPPDDQLYLMLGYGLYSVLAGGLWAYSGLQFKHAKQYGLCLVACVTAFIPVASPCCLLGLIFGVMGLVKLNDPRVKQGFQANRPGYDPDAPA